jgi:hypothetical protein
MRVKTSNPLYMSIQLTKNRYIVTLMTGDISSSGTRAVNGDDFETLHNRKFCSDPANRQKILDYSKLR